jgi:hypothetical protein
LYPQIGDSENAMATQGQRTGYRLIRPKNRPVTKKYSARRFPIQSEIQRLEEELDAFNDRIAELENEGPRSHAMDVLKANALDFAQRIDELRCALIESVSKETGK